MSADAADQRSFIVDLAHLELFAWRLPCALAANAAGTLLAPRIDPARFRLISCGVVLVAGAVTITSA